MLSEFFARKVNRQSPNEQFFGRLQVLLQTNKLESFSKKEQLTASIRFLLRRSLKWPSDWLLTDW